MEISKIGYYPEFIFHCKDFNYTFKTTDINELKKIVYEHSKERAWDFIIGENIIFQEQYPDMVFEITNIEIKQIVDNTDFFNIGIGQYDFIDQIGKKAVSVFLILIHIKVVV